MTGILLLAMSSVMPVLVLERREASGLVWALLATGYGLMTGLMIEGMSGVRAIGPSTSP